MLLRELLGFLICNSPLDPRIYEFLFVPASIFRVDCFVDCLHPTSKTMETWALRKEGFKCWKSSFMMVQRK